MKKQKVIEDENKYNLTSKAIEMHYRVKIIIALCCIGIIGCFLVWSALNGGAQ